MSAFQVSARHIAVMVDHAIALQVIGRQEREPTMAMLAGENARSMNWRYHGTPHTEVATFPEVSKFREFGPSAVLKSIECYRYQSCEHDGWENSDAAKFCTRLTTYVIASLPGYEEAPWGIE